MSMQTSKAAILAAVLILGAGVALAQNKYDPGASDGEITIGQTNPYSGPLSSYSTQGKVQAAYYTMVNEQGGVNGRKSNLSRSMTATVRREPSNSIAKWSRKTTSSPSWARWKRRPTPLSSST